MNIVSEAIVLTLYDGRGAKASHVIPSREVRRAHVARLALPSYVITVVTRHCRVLEIRLDAELTSGTFASRSGSRRQIGHNEDRFCKTLGLRVATGTSVPLILGMSIRRNDRVSQGLAGTGRKLNASL